MSDNKQHSGGQDRTRIDVNEDYELRDWSKKFGVTPQQLREAVKAVGTQAAQVQQYLESRGSHKKQPHHEHPEAASQQQQAGLARGGPQKSDKAGKADMHDASAKMDKRDSGAHGAPGTRPVADEERPVHEAPHQAYSAPRS